MAVEDKQCRLCDIKKTATMVIAERPSQLSIEEFNKMQPIEVANRYFITTTGEPMTEKQQEMFNYIYRLVQEENRQ